jgi:hypothetical protein
MAVAANIGTAARAPTKHAWAPAALACMGIVFGDIGTSPLYTTCLIFVIALGSGLTRRRRPACSRNLVGATVAATIFSTSAGDSEKKSPVPPAVNRPRTECSS